MAEFQVHQFQIVQSVVAFLWQLPALCQYPLQAPTTTTYVVDQDRCALVMGIVCALWLGPMLIRQGRQVLRGHYPKKSTYEYRRSVSLINVYNSLRGGPLEVSPPEWQWKALGYVHIISGALLISAIPYCLVLLAT